jgi:hypothetical protein
MGYYDGTDDYRRRYRGRTKIVQAVVDVSYFIEFMRAPFEEKFQWILSYKIVTTALFIRFIMSY